MDEQRFLASYWQKKPLLIRQAFPAFQSPLSADELAGLAMEPDTTPRLITLDEQGQYHLEHGPFEEEKLVSLTGNNWSLLVTDVEKHLPDLLPYLKPFHFLPTWRIDDLMVSYAPVGASVGAHIDEYDVFLLQASGSRQWSIDERPIEEHSFIEDAELKLVDAFSTTASWDLLPGDMLYLPPGVAHHGVASSASCTTWSIGFRAPAVPDLVMRISEIIAERLPWGRYQDKAITTVRPGEISDQAIDTFNQIWQEATQLNRPELAELIGRIITESAAGDYLGDIPSQQEELPATLKKAPFSRMAWCHCNRDEVPDATVTLFADGEAFICSQQLAEALCCDEDIPPQTLNNCSETEKQVLLQLYQSGSLISD